MKNEPSTNGANGGRNSAGRFAIGNPGGPGNPFVKHVAEFRAIILECSTPDETRAIWRKLIEMAKGGNLAAIKEYNDRILGRVPNDELVDKAVETIQNIEEMKAQRAGPAN